VRLHAFRNSALDGSRIAAELFDVGSAVPANIGGPDYRHLAIDREFAEMVLDARFQ
jgi:hypothetical protein